MTAVRAAVGSWGRLRATGVIPKLLERLRISGVNLPLEIFQEVVPVNL